MLGFGSAIVGKVVFAAECLVAAVLIVVAGYAHQVVGLTSQISDGVAISNSPSVGAMNVLVMGLESRTNFEGQDLSVKELTETHSGNAQSVKDNEVGAQDTDTLILIHIFDGGKKAAGYSLPRDDVVNYPHATLDGLTEGKIDAAYDYAYNESLGQTIGTSMSSSQRYLQANQAGQLFEVQTVESVTGVHIDHFVESNIIGFYYLAQQFGGIDVCIQPAPAQGGLARGANLTDYDKLTNTDNSGFDAYNDGYNRKKGGAQYLHLSPAQSLAYVRSRDTLPGVDIGRTARQQAVLDYVIWKVKAEGLLSDLGTLTGLLSSAKNYLITDSGWNLPEFAGGMSGLSGKDLDFKTLPSAPTNDVEVPGYPSPQSVNFIDVPQIQQLVQKAFYGKPLARPSAAVTMDVYNGGTKSGLATDISQDLVAMGYKAGKVDNSSDQSQPVQEDTSIFYGAGAETDAEAIANDTGTTATALSSLPAGHVEVLLGSKVTAASPGLLTFGADTVTAQDYLNAAQADHIAIPSNATKAAGATQSVGASLVGSRPSGGSVASGASGASGASVASGASAGSKAGAAASKPAKKASGGTPAIAPRYGITSCVY